MNIRNHIEYGAVVALLGLCRLLPERLIHSLFTSLAKLMHALLGSRRRMALQNMEIAFPEKTDAERKSLVKQAFVHLADSMTLNTLITSGRISNKRLLDCVETEGWERFEAALDNEEGKGVLFISGHLGNWELMPQYVALRRKKPVHVIARKSNNTLMEDRVVRPLRERFGVTVFYKKNAMMRILKAVKRHETTGLLIDQRLNLRQGVPCNFFGRTTGTTGTPALLQIRYGIDVIPVFMIKTSPMKYRMTFGESVAWTDNGKPMEEQVIELTQIHQKLIEDAIRIHPEQWFWMHNRWGI
ncbi:lysophospholipid acyltransferase family protein [Pontiella sulfatireligans]|uniref:Lipid A biosynthesis palmitoleoyltransferase n=1 Tax=Pontiella sulfatireligans TaxID=2750658 RepID=A0A6C2UIZ9_9BACT|nr:lysophospholipid acyltransferase family protein [Pontiella sulfatireligans]VGO20195.1 Lipid A biosynthesis palmitoleoyltransferase [Pontiella sulfatireligans]